MKQEMTRWQWHQLYHMQIICTLLQADNYTSTSSLNITGHLLFLTPNAENLHSQLAATLLNCTKPQQKIK